MFIRDGMAHQESDCSGSMWNDLPLIREQIKLKLPMLLAEDDTITLIWFSGAGRPPSPRGSRKLSKITNTGAPDDVLSTSRGSGELRLPQQALHRSGVLGAGGI